MGKEVEGKGLRGGEGKEGKERGKGRGRGHVVDIAWSDF